MTAPALSLREQLRKAQANVIEAQRYYGETPTREYATLLSRHKGEVTRLARLIITQEARDR